jgi:hypothetical protein
MVAFMLVAVMGVTAIALDVGRFYVVNNELQTALDAAALAGAHRMQKSALTDTAALRADIQAHVTAFVAANNRVDNAAYSVLADSVRLVFWDAGYVEPRYDYGSMTPARRPNGVAIQYHKQPPVIFAGIIGRGAPALHKRSVAWVANINSRDCVRPWAMPYKSLYQLATGVRPAGIAPDLTQDQLQTLSNKPDSERLLTLVGSNQQIGAPTPANDSSWVPFNFGGNSGKPDFQNGLRGCDIYEVGTSAANGTTLPGAANQYINWSTEVIWKNVGQGDNRSPCYRKAPGDAGCYASAAATSPGVTISAVFADVTGVGSNTIDYRFVGQIDLVCYYQGTPASVCPQVPAGHGNTGYPEGTIVVRMHRFGSPIIEPETVLGTDPSLEQRILLVK